MLCPYLHRRLTEIGTFRSLCICYLLIYEESTFSAFSRYMTTFGNFCIQFIGSSTTLCTSVRPPRTLYYDHLDDHLDLRRDKKDARHAWLMDGSVVVRGCAPRRRGCSGTCLRRNGSRGLSSIVFVRALRSISLPLSPRGEHGVRREQSVCWRHELGHHFRRVAGAF